jgi:hypothetical protein
VAFVRGIPTDEQIEEMVLAFQQAHAEARAAKRRRHRRRE